MKLKTRQKAEKEISFSEYPEKDIDKEFNFDFSIYEREEKEIEILKSVKKINKPRITNLRSKFSPSLSELESISTIKSNISQVSIKVASYSQDIKDLWEMYGCLNEYWARISDIFGSIIIKEIDEIKTDIVKKLLVAQQKDRLHYGLHNQLLKFRDKVYILAQRVNLGFEVEKSSRGTLNKAQNMIVE